MTKHELGGERGTGLHVSRRESGEDPKKRLGAHMTAVVRPADHTRKHSTGRTADSALACARVQARPRLRARTGTHVCLLVRVCACVRASSCACKCVRGRVRAHRACLRASASSAASSTTSRSAAAKAARPSLDASGSTQCVRARGDSIRLACANAQEKGGKMRGKAHRGNKGCARLKIPAHAHLRGKRLRVRAQIERGDTPNGALVTSSVDSFVVRHGTTHLFCADVLARADGCARPH
eukprot:4761848-Pleurochrysis_carterae.AAC.1